MHHLPALMQNSDFFLYVPMSFSIARVLTFPHSSTDLLGSQHLRAQMTTIIHALASTSTSYAYGSKTADWGNTYMVAFVHGGSARYPSPPFTIPQSSTTYFPPNAPAGPASLSNRARVTYPRDCANGDASTSAHSSGLHAAFTVTSARPARTALATSSWRPQAERDRGCAPVSRRGERVAAKGPCDKEEFEPERQGRAVEVYPEERVVDIAPEVKMDPKFRKRWMHTSLDQLKRAYPEPVETEQEVVEVEEIAPRAFTLSSILSSTYHEFRILAAPKAPSPEPPAPAPSSPTPRLAVPRHPPANGPASAAPTAPTHAQRVKDVVCGDAQPHARQPRCNTVGVVIGGEVR